MAKIYPNLPVSSSPLASISAESEPASLTVWRKSLLFNCSGFTVFDSKGNLIFRVDNYSSTSRTKIVLMDAAGKPLYTIRRKVPDPFNPASLIVSVLRNFSVRMADVVCRGSSGMFCTASVQSKKVVQMHNIEKLSIADRWNIYDGEESAARPRFSVRKHVTLLPSKELAYVTNYGQTCGEEGIIYCIEGSFSHRSCLIYDDHRRQVAEIRQKEAVAGVSFKGDVFRLVVQPGFDTELAMAVVILLEQMFGSRVAALKD